MPPPPTPPSITCRNIIFLLEAFCFTTHEFSEFTKNYSASVSRFVMRVREMNAFYLKFKA